MKVFGAHFSRKGKKDRNEDSLLPLFEAKDRWWAAIADGMGGRPGGEIASKTVIDAIGADIREGHDSNINQLFSRAQKALQRVASENPLFKDMGTTLSILCIEGRSAKVGHVGDSRIYHLRSEGLEDRTIDQTEVEELLQRGILTRQSARRYPRRNVLLSVLAANRPFDLYLNNFEVKGGDRLVLLTDGAHSKVLRREIRDLSLRMESPSAFCDALAQEIANRSPNDDFSAICVDVKMDDETSI